MATSNIKIHFACAEAREQAEALKMAGVNYALGSVYSHIKPEYSKPSASRKFDKSIIDFWHDSFNSTILDSGIFTLIYGGDKNKKFPKEAWYQWMDALVDFVHSTGYTGFPVEVDAQKILGVEETWKIRTQMQDKLPNNKIITVWHPQDGQKGLDRLIEFSDYTALSVQELRTIKGIDHKEYAYKLASYIKNKKPDIKIHLLGCTEMGLLQKLNFCTSADSSAWLQINKFRRFKIIEDGKISVAHPDDIQESIEPYYDIVRNNYTGKGEMTPKKLEIQARFVMALEQLIKIYSKFAGPQD